MERFVNNKYFNTNAVFSWEAVQLLKSKGDVLLGLHVAEKSCSQINLAMVLHYNLLIQSVSPQPFSLCAN